MSARWDVAHVYGAKMTNNVEDSRYEEYDDRFDALDLYALESDATPKPGRDTAQEYISAGYAHKSSKSNHNYDLVMSTPPLSPSTTVSSLPAEETHYLSDESLSSQMDRDEVRRGKQPTSPVPEEDGLDDYLQDDSDWYGMQYALEQSRYEYPGSGVWPPTAGESSTSDAAFVAMYDGHIYPQDVAYWYEHWCKWHRALAREEKRRRDRAASDAKRTRVYNHATYVEWERSQNKKRMAQAGVGSKPMTPTRHRSSTCLF